MRTLEPKQQDGDKVVFNRYSEQNQKSELPLFLVDVKYEDKASVAAERKEQSVPACTKDKKFVDAGEGDFSGRAVSQARPSSGSGSSYSSSPSSSPSHNNTSSS